MRPKVRACLAEAGSQKVPDRLFTPRLVLRPLQPGDAEGLHAFFSDPEAMELWGKPHAELAETQAWVDSTLKAPPERTMEYAVLRDDIVIGRAGIWRSPELGFFLRRDAWGQGLMQEALDALLPRLFDRMDLERIVADVDARNRRSQRLLKTLGFFETGRAENAVEVDGEMTDSVYLALDRG